MKVVRLTDDQRDLVLKDEPLPVIGRYEVLVRVHAASLNFRDQAVLNDAYGGPVGKNVVVLSDGAGEVVAIGSAVTRAKVGDRVTSSCTPHWIGGPYLGEYQSSSHGWTVDGWLGEHVVLHENGIVHLPAYLSYAEAACLPCAAVSAWSALQLATPLQPGQVVLIQGTGGVALFGLQIAKLFGARVLAITSTEEKAERLKQLGAEAVVNYRTTPNWDQAILDLTDGKGVDKVVEIAGDATIVKSAACTKIGGEIGLVGFASGFGGGLPPIDILARTLRIGGITIGPRTSFDALLAAMNTTKMRPIIDQQIPFLEYREAYRRLASGNHVGKVVIDITA
jgi:NADPH:quinone reductase-like Zn-dependent oxidoreductase